MSAVGDCPKIIKPPHVLSCTHFVSHGFMDVEAL